jgi:amidase
MPRQAKKKSKKTWQDIALAAQKHRDASFNDFLVVNTFPKPENLPRRAVGIPEQMLSPDDAAITALSIHEIVELTSTGALSARAVTLAFLRRASIAQKLASPRSLYTL